jgi:hypothetical protein
MPLLTPIVGNPPILRSFTFVNLIVEVLTVGLWWSMLEAGLSLIAACLPTLSFLFTHFNLQTTLRSIQSVFSLRSIMHTSHHSAPSDPQLNPYVDLEASKSKMPSESVTATSENASRSGASVEEYRMHDLHN